MIAYEFKCTTCEKRILALHRMGGAPDTKPCVYEDCEGQMTRMLSRGAFVTVPGAYSDTYRSK